MFSNRAIGLLVSAFVIAAPHTLSAASKTYSGVGQGSMEKGREACRQEAVLDGQKAALRAAIKGAGEIYKPLLHNPIVARAGEFVGKKKVSGEKYNLNGRCQLNVKARVDVGKLKRALKRRTGDGTMVAVMVCQFADGAMVRGSGVSELRALNIAMRELQASGCRTTSLHEHYTYFCQRLKPKEYAVTGDAIVKQKLETETLAEATARILRELNERLTASGENPLGGELLDLVLIGGVNITERGRDPDSERYNADGDVGMSVHRLSTLEAFAATEFTQRGQGVSVTAAANHVLNAAINQSISKISSDSQKKHGAAICTAGTGSR